METSQATRTMPAHFQAPTKPASWKGSTRLRSGVHAASTGWAKPARDAIGVMHAEKTTQATTVKIAMINTATPITAIAGSTDSPKNLSIHQAASPGPSPSPMS